MARPPKSKLSKHILEMKFMKRTKEKVEKEENDAEGRSMYEGNITEEMDKLGNKYIIEPSLSICAQSNFGRMSFRGMNPEIEKIMTNKEAGAANGKMDGVTNQEMAERYSTLVGTMNKKFSTKRQMQRNGASPQAKRSKNVFLKPSD